MLAKIRGNAILGSLLISIASFFVSAQSCSESHEARLLSEAANRASILPKGFYIDETVSAEGVVTFRLATELKNYGKSPALWLMWDAKYSINNSHQYSPHPPFVSGVVEPDKEADSYVELGFSNEQLHILDDGTFTASLRIMFVDSLTKKLYSNDYCYTRKGGNFSGPNLKTSHSIVGLTPCSSDWQNLISTGLR